MAKKVNNSFFYIGTPHRKRPVVISKCKTSKLKSFKNYKKSYRGQERA